MSKKEGKDTNTRYDDNAILIKSYEEKSGALARKVQDNTEAVTGLKEQLLAPHLRRISLKNMGQTGVLLFVETKLWEQEEALGN